MWLVNAVLRRPVTVAVAILGLLGASLLSVQRMKIDIFPQLGSPTVYVAQPYGGMDPSQVEAFLTYFYEYHFLYITGIEHVESKSIQGVSLMKLVFHADTNMNQAMAEVVAQVNRSRAFMPPGAVPPFVVRFDAGSVPVGQLVFSSPTRSPGEMQDIAINRVRPLFATLPGVSAPPPFGGNQRTIVVRVDPERLRAYDLTPDAVVTAVSRANAVLPSGNVRIGDETLIASTNTVIGADFSELANAPIRQDASSPVFIRDVATVENGTDIVTGYAHIDGRRTVYIPVTKRADASTLDVVARVRAALPAMQAVVPDDVTVSLEFDQSGYVRQSLRSLVTEGALGALLTGVMVLLFLRDWRSVIVVVTTIPIALLAAVVGLWLTGQTLNIMTLAGLALAVGVLVDEATVLVENIHTQMEAGASPVWAVIAAARRTAVPRLLAMACVVAVFVPSFFMTGVGRQLFVPLSLAVGLAMVASYVLSSTLVPVMAAWLLRARQQHAGAPPGSDHGADGRRTDESSLPAARSRYGDLVRGMVAHPVVVTAVYLASTVAIIALIYPRLGVELFPRVDAGQVQMRLRAPTGTRIEKTELIAEQALAIVKGLVGPEHVAVSMGFVGVQPPSYPINTIYLWTSGPHEAVITIGLGEGARLRGPALEERIRGELREQLPDVQVSFEAADIVARVMSFGANTPIEIAVQGPNVAANRAHAEKIHAELARIPALRDLQYGQPLDYPTLRIEVDRDRAGRAGMSSSGVVRSLVAATSSSRFVEPVYWRDPGSGNAFQIQVEVPQHEMASVEDIRGLPVSSRDHPGVMMGDVASISRTQSAGMVERYNMQRVVSLTANVYDTPLGQIVPELSRAIAAAGEPARGVTVAVRGQVPALEETIEGLAWGVLFSIAVIFLLLAANFQSFRLALAVVATVPAVIAGVLLMLLVTRTTLNVQSFMGAIMAIGIAVANAILLVTFAESERQDGASAPEAAVAGARTRLRAILMTAAAMIAGMLPIALGFGDGAEQTTPLGRAVVGGLLAATITTLFILPAIYAALQRRASTRSASLHPLDARGLRHEPPAV
jgi:multidrug efflux pump subunit AcrB